MFNVFNTVNYALPENVIGDAGTDFGKITESVGGPRVMQFGLRFRFSLIWSAGAIRRAMLHSHNMGGICPLERACATRNRPG